MLQQARALRKNQTPAEIILWKALRNRQMDDIKFRRQVPIGSYIVDYYCAELRLVIEIDGSSHMGHEKYDAERTHWLKSCGYHIIRFTNDDVRMNLNQVIESIRETITAWQIPSPLAGEG